MNRHSAISQAHTKLVRFVATGMVAEGRVYHLFSDDRAHLTEAMHRRRHLFGGSLLLVIGVVLLRRNAMLSLGTRWANKYRVIYIVRHGEKEYDAANHTAFDYACLSEKGWARAYNLKVLFGPRPQPPFRTPSALFAANYGNSIDCREGSGRWYRTQATLEPLAAPAPGGLNLTVDNTTGWLPHLCSPSERGLCMQHNLTTERFAEPHQFGTCCNVAAAAKLKAKLAEPGTSTILVAWEHANMRNLAVSLGAPDCDTASTTACHLDWDGTDFDAVWAVTFDSTGQHFVNIQTDLVQGFSSVGNEWLGPKRGCGAVAPAGFANPRQPSGA